MAEACPSGTSLVTAPASTIMTPLALARSASLGSLAVVVAFSASPAVRIAKSTPTKPAITTRVISAFALRESLVTPVTLPFSCTLSGDANGSFAVDAMLPPTRTGHDAAPCPK